MKKQNIFRIEDECELEEISLDNPNKIIVIMYSLSDCIPCKKIKPYFINVSKQFLDCMFIYIQLTNFSQKKFVYTNFVKATPYFAFYFNDQLIGKCDDGKEETFINTLIQIYDMVNAVIQQNKINSNNASNYISPDNIVKVNSQHDERNYVSGDGIIGNNNNDNNNDNNDDNGDDKKMKKINKIAEMARVNDLMEKKQMETFVLLSNNLKK